MDEKEQIMGKNKEEDESHHNILFQKEHEGKRYCGVHDPVKREAKRKLAQEKWYAEYDRAKTIRECKSKALRLIQTIHDTRGVSGSVLDEIGKVLERMK